MMELWSSYNNTIAFSKSASSAERLILVLSVLAGGGLMWLSPRLPMLDLPQHAAQIALWRDLLLHKSHWSHLVYINLLTPYLIGYGAALPLSFIFSTETSVRIVLTIAFFAFIGACVAVRRELGADKRLDWLFLPGFFGFDWKMGFVTFLAAAPALMGFILLALRYRSAPGFGRGLGLLACGIALLFSHGLSFLFGMLIGGLLLLGPLRENVLEKAKRLWPIIVLTAILVLFVVVTSERSTAAHYDHWRIAQPLWLRPAAILFFISGINWNLDPRLAGVALIMMLTPLFIGCRPNPGPSRVLMASLLFVLFALPDEAFQTGYLYVRFALFLMPFVAFQFRAPEKSDPVGTSVLPAHIVMIVSCVAILMIQGNRIWAFRIESQKFNQIERAAEPGKRALSLIFDGASKAAQNKVVYDHFPSWYQADDHGFVDFNFAAFHPQVVRFRPKSLPVIGQSFIKHMDAFNWQKDQGWLYDYFFIRGDASRVAWLQALSPCKLSLIVAAPPWFLVQRLSCPTQGHTPS